MSKHFVHICECHLAYLNLLFAFSLLLLVLLQWRACVSIKRPYVDITYFGKLSQLMTLHCTLVTHIICERPHTASANRPRWGLWHRFSPTEHAFICWHRPEWSGNSNHIGISTQCAISHFCKCNCRTSAFARDFILPSGSVIATPANTLERS